MSDERRHVRVEGRELVLSNLDKVLYPETGTTKAEVIDYVARIAPWQLPHLAGRCITLRRFPDGVDRPGFFEKRCPSHRPSWIATSAGPGDRGGPIGYCRLEEPAALVWAANLAAVELHVPMARADDLEHPTILVLDVDPGAPAGMAECAQVALAAREVLGAVGLEGWAKTSGSKGMQVYVPLNGGTDPDRPPVGHEEAATFALALGQVLERRLDGLVLVDMARARRGGRVLVDWSQNARHKTTIGVYSLRARERPTVSTPVTWVEVAAAADGRTPLRFEAADVLDRVSRYGDLFAPVLTVRQDLPAPRR